MTLDIFLLTQFTGYSPKKIKTPARIIGIYTLSLNHKTTA